MINNVNGGSVNLAELIGITPDKLASPKNAEQEVMFGDKTTSPEIGGVEGQSKSEKAEYFSWDITIDGKDYQITNSEHIDNMQTFLRKGAEGSEEAVLAVVSKGIEPTMENLEAVRTAIRECRIPDGVLVKELKDTVSKNQLAFLKLPKEAVAKLEQAMAKKLTLNQAAKNLLLEKMGELGKDSEFEVLASDSGKKPSLLDVLKALQEVYQKSSESSQAIHTRTSVSASSSSYKTNDKNKSSYAKEVVHNRIKGAQTDTFKGEKEFSQADEAGRGRKMNNGGVQRKVKDDEDALSKPDLDLHKEEAGRSKDVDSSEVSLQKSQVNEEIDLDNLDNIEAEAEKIVALALDGLLERLNDIEGQFDVKRYLVRETSERMVTAAKEFQAMQQEVGKALSKTSPAAIKKSIESMTKAINKSTFAMFTDMKTEKVLLNNLSKLEKASAAMKMRDFQLARKLATEVKEEIEKLEFKPTSRKVIAHASRQAAELERAFKEKSATVKERIMEATSLFSSGTARDMVERIRFMGVNHEIERYEQQKSEIRNLRELFMQDGMSMEMSTGEQMLNDSDDRQRDFYVLNVPLEVGGEVSGMKVFVSGRCEENVVDWKNTELYFALEVQKNERVGMRFSITDKNVKIELRGDREIDLGNIGDELSQIGYQLISVKQVDMKSKEGETGEKTTNVIAGLRSGDYEVTQQGDIDGNTVSRRSFEAKI